jgi:hypothetical protein
VADHWTLGTFTFAAGEEQSFVYEYTGIYLGLNIATPEPSIPPGGSFVATAQGIRNIGPNPYDPWIQYLVTIKNWSGFEASCSIRIDRLP